MVANVDARVHTDPGEWPGLLSAQLCSPVRWRQSLEALSGRGATVVAELGPGRRAHRHGPTDHPRRARRGRRRPRRPGQADGHGDRHRRVDGIVPGPPGRAPLHVRAGHRESRLRASSSPMYSWPRWRARPWPRPRRPPGSGRASNPGSILAVGDRVGTVGLTDVRTPFDGILVRWLAVRGERVVEGQPVAWIRTPGSSVDLTGTPFRRPGPRRRRVGWSWSPVGPGASAWPAPSGSWPRATGWRSPPASGAVEEDVVDGPGELLSLACDVTDPAQVEAAFAAVEERWAPVEVLVANAGITRDTLVLRMEEDAWSEVIDTNLSGAFRVTKRALSKMIRLHRGRVIWSPRSGPSSGPQARPTTPPPRPGWWAWPAPWPARWPAGRSRSTWLLRAWSKPSMLAALGEERMSGVRGPGAVG